MRQPLTPAENLRRTMSRRRNKLRRLCHQMSYMQPVDDVPIRVMKREIEKRITSAIAFTTMDGISSTVNWIIEARGLVSGHIWDLLHRERISKAQSKWVCKEVMRCLST